MKITIFAPNMLPCLMEADTVFQHPQTRNPVVENALSCYEFAPVVVIADEAGKILYSPPESIEDWPDAAYLAINWRNN